MADASRATAAAIIAIDEARAARAFAKSEAERRADAERSTGECIASLMERLAQAEARIQRETDNREIGVGALGAGYSDLRSLLEDLKERVERELGRVRKLKDGKPGDNAEPVSNEQISAAIAAYLKANPTRPERVWVGGNSSHSPLNVVTVDSATYNVQNSDDIVKVTGTCAVLMLDARYHRERSYRIKRTGSGTVTINFQSGQTCDGLTPILLDTIYDAVELLSDGQNWLIV